MRSGLPRRRTARAIAAVAAALLAANTLVLLQPSAAQASTPSSTGEFNYAEALQDSMLFYESQRSGPLPADNRVLWRGPSDLSDGADHGLDLTGGYHDAGDEVKFGLPAAYSMTTLAWGAIDDKAGYQKAGQWSYVERNLRWGDDFIIKAHPAPHVFYGQVGDGGSDHGFWGPAEVNPSPRPSYAVTEACPGSDLVGQSAAALAASSIVFKTDDPAYSATLVAQAKSLYEFADDFRGKYDACITGASSFYTSFSGYWDELVWGAIWLYKATGDATYLTKAQNYFPNMNKANQTTTPEYAWTISWDDSSFACYLLLAQLTGQQQYIDDAERNLDWFTTGYNGQHVATSPGGEVQVDVWGTARYAANEAYLALDFANWLKAQNVDPARQQAYHDFAVRQMNYILGDNPNHESYEVGFTNGGTNTAWPQGVHNRTAHGSWDQSMSDPATTRHVDYGMLVGGPTSGDGFTDTRQNYQQTEGALDYNSLFSGALAELTAEYGGTPRANFPPAETPDGPEELMQAAPNQTGSNFIEIKAQVVNKSGWPARHLTNGSFRYYFTLDPGETASQIQVTSPYSQCSAPGPVTQFSGSTYYITISCAGQDIAPAGQSAFHREVQFRLTFPAAHDYTKDWSFQGLAGLATNATPVNTNYIELYDGSTKVWGTGPGGGSNVTPPSAPGKPAASAVTATGATLTWSASAAGTNPVAGYDVFSVSGSTATKVGSSTTTSATLTGLTPSTAYTLDVVARDGAGNVSAASPTVSVTTAAATPPGAPSGLTVTGVTASTVGLSWTAAAPGTLPIANYVVYQAGTPATAVATVAGTATSATVSGLSPATTYQLYVVAKDSGGQSSPASATVPATTGTAPPASLTARYQTSVTAATTGQIQPMLNLVNNGNSAIALSSVTVRYWFTSDGGAGTFSTNCWYALVGCGNLTQSVVAMPTPVTGADHYLQVGFTAGAGSLAVGASTGQIQSAINKTDWSNFTQTGDYSFNAADTAFTANPLVTVYVSGKLVYGTEPH
ncbi:MAG: glycoside hydrolase family 9 protein [Catenulisporales bacterium]|nr:glycoside hydrolase family 9 protein [Catenulisporales bacterium]